ncbi:glycosyltransferase family 4 protein [Halorarius litoreus]|uniref:glycosyltransferase family 4 protein n=1 Tax=Halorarius litoreus TaxID=2962676 RepID=UPI0020CC2116|nr:glycosyltransferase family 4 protein [Halorarius litoreus]
MRPVLCNTYDFGGAGTATTRIHRGLRRIGVDSRMLVQIQRGDEPGVTGPDGTLRRIYSMGRVVTDSLPLRLYGGANDDFSVNWLPDDFRRQLDALEPDVVHLNWVGEGFFSPTSLGTIHCPIVWRLPDMWAFTGGCHYADGCERYQDACGACPKLDSSTSRDLSRWTWWRKHRAWEDADITVVGPSNWIAERARESSLFGNRRVEVIPNALDTEVYKPRDSAVGRDLFDLPADARVVLFGAAAPDDPRKGADLLREALTELTDNGAGEDIVQVVFGTSAPEEPLGTGFETRYTGYLNDDQSLALLYAAADVMVVPSRYEGFGQTASEALACGTPVVAFDATGPSDIVDHRENGYLATPYDPSSLAEGIEWVLADEGRRDRLSEAARTKAVRSYAMETVAEQYRDLYADIC